MHVEAIVPTPLSVEETLYLTFNVHPQPCDLRGFNLAPGTPAGGYDANCNPAAYMLYRSSRGAVPMASPPPTPPPLQSRLIAPRASAIVQRCLMDNKWDTLLCGMLLRVHALGAIIIRGAPDGTAAPECANN